MRTGERIGSGSEEQSPGSRLGILALCVASALALSPAVLEPWIARHIGAGTRERLLEGAFLAAAIIAVLALLLAMRDRPFWRLLASVPLAALVWVAFVTGAMHGADGNAHGAQLIKYALLGAVASHALRRRFRDSAVFAVALAVCVSVGALDEMLQWWMPRQFGAIGEVRASLYGGLCGCGLSAVLWLERCRLTLGRRGLAAVLWAAAAVVLMLAFVVDMVHLGHPVEVSEGRAVLRSRYAADELQLLAQSWHPPAPDRAPLQLVRSGDDWFAREAEFHRQQRDAFVARDEMVAAYQEQAALTRFYAAWLDWTPDSRVQPTVAARLSQAAPVARELPRDLGPPYLLTSVDRLTLWLAVATLATGLGLGAEGLLMGRTTA